MKTHTLGFIFNPTFSKVLLVEKQRPDWQKGRLNGVGGKIEQGEKSLNCIVREVREESNLEIQKENWAYVGEIKSSVFLMDVDVYAAIYGGNLNDAITTTNEIVGWHDIKNLPEKILPNINWLVPLAIDKLKNNEFKLCSVHY